MTLLCTMSSDVLVSVKYLNFTFLFFLARQDPENANSAVDTRLNCAVLERVRGWGRYRITTAFEFRLEFSPRAELLSHFARSASCNVYE